MKLSDAIEVGAQLRPQAFGSYFTGTSRADACSCALGAAYEATFPDRPLAHDALVNDFDRTLAVTFPILKAEEKLFCPECAGASSFNDNLCNVLIHLNDEHRWPRERIAGYVRGFER